MRRREIYQLKRENERLSHMAEHDWLTGLYNRGAVEKRIDACLMERRQGVIFALDVDQFKQINDRYGHIAGDMVLKEIAASLPGLTFCNDILGRIGGDEFVIFMPVCQTREFAESRCRQIRQYFMEHEFLDSAVLKLSVTVCAALYRNGDTYRSLFDRADQSLLAEKKRRGSRERQRRANSASSLETDLIWISRELSEPSVTAGAFCQDYDTFVGIYRFVERRMRRVHSSVYSLLFTLSDGNGDFPSLQERECQMSTLKEVICSGLRLCDVFTQYSSCQYLVMISDVMPQEADQIGQRILCRYREKIDLPDNLSLNVQRYPLRAAVVTDAE